MNENSKRVLREGANGPTRHGEDVGRTMVCGGSQATRTTYAGVRLAADEFAAIRKHEQGVDDVSL